MAQGKSQGKSKGKPKEKSKKDAIAGMTREQLEEKLRAWEESELADFITRQPESQSEYKTASGLPLNRIYTALDKGAGGDGADDIGLPGQYPFTRGPYPTMYRGRLWTMRQLAGYGTGADTNERMKYLLAHGNTGLSVDFDMPTLMGYDSDHAMSRGEVGREGVAVDTLADLEALFDGIDLTEISVSMTINPTGWILMAMYIAVAEGRGYDLNKLSGTIQNDILKEYTAQKEWIYPPKPSMRLVRDTIVYGARNMKRYNAVNISGYHISEAGATSLQEAAFTMCNAIAYVEEVIKAGVAVDDFAPRLSYYFIAQADFFEEVAKGRDAKLAANWVITNLFGALNKAEVGIADSPVTAENLGKLIDLISDDTISGRIAKDVFEIMIETGGDPEKIVEEKGLKQITDTGAIETAIDEVIAANPDKVEEIRAGKDRMLGWFVGQVMKSTGGKANPGMVNKLLRDKILG